MAFSFTGGPFGGSGGMGVISGSDEVTPQGMQMMKNIEKQRAIEAEKQKFQRQEGMQNAQFREAMRQRKLKALDKQFGQLGESTGQFIQTGVRQEEPFTQEQHALSQMFGGGEKFWGANDPVHINHDLNPSKNGDFGTADAFGFGSGGGRAFGDGQRSGLF